MIEFRWIKRSVPVSDEVSRFERALEYRHWVPFIAASGDVVLDHREWTDWATVEDANET